MVNIFQWKSVQGNFVIFPFFVFPWLTDRFFRFSADAKQLKKPPKTKEEMASYANPPTHPSPPRPSKNDSLLSHADKN